MTLDALIGVAQLWADTSRQEEATELLGLVLNHPAVESSGAQVGKALFAKLRQALPAEQFEAALERGKGMGLDAAPKNTPTPGSEQIQATPPGITASGGGTQSYHPAAWATRLDGRMRVFVTRKQLPSGDSTGTDRGD